MKLNHKHIHIYFVFMHFINIWHQPIDPQMAPKVVVNLGLFRRILLHINENRSWELNFWIFACGGNEHQWTNVSLCAELWEAAKVPVEQEGKFYFSKICGCGMFYALYISLCSVDI